MSFSLSLEDLEKKYSLFRENISIITNGDIVYFLFGIEIEFYVHLKLDRSVEIDLNTRYLSILKQEIKSFAHDNNIKIFDLVTEKGFNQFEINFKPYKSIIKLCQDIDKIKSMNSNIFDFDFSVKPYVNKPANSMHISLSAYDTEFRNIFNINEKYMNLCVYGILKNAIKTCYLYASKEEDYIRYIKNKTELTIFEPYNISYGIDNRTCLVRYPKYSIKDAINDKRFEFRGCSSEADLHLALYAIISSINNAFEDKYSLTNLDKYTIYGNANDIYYSDFPILPRNLNVAKYEFDESVLL